MADKRPFYLRQWRKYRGYTLERLAEMVGTSQGYLSDLEKQKRRWNEDLLEALAIALQCDPADFLTRDPSQPEGLTRLVARVEAKLPAAEQDHFRKVIETFDKTGTEG